MDLGGGREDRRSKEDKGSKKVEGDRQSIRHQFCLSTGCASIRRDVVMVM